MTDEKKYRTEVPNIIDDLGLDPYERTLYVHYKRVCGANGGQCTEGVRGTADRTKISQGKVSSVRAKLVKRGLIQTRPFGEVGGVAITVVDIWSLNSAYYAATDRPNVDGWTVKRLTEWTNGGVHCMNTPPTIMEEGQEIEERCSPDEQGCSLYEQGCSLYEHKKEPLKNEPIKESDDEEESHVREEKAAAIMAIYQNNINISESPLTTQEMLSDEFLDLPLFWWQEAVKIATDNSVRKWSYVRGILLRSKKAGLSPVAAGSPNGNGAGPGKARGDSSSLFPPPDPDAPEPERIELTPEELILEQFKDRARQRLGKATWDAHISNLSYLDRPNGRIRLACRPASVEWLESERLARVLDPIAQELSPGGFEYVVT